AAPASGSRRATPRSFIAKAYANSPQPVHPAPRGAGGRAAGGERPTLGPRPPCPWSAATQGGRVEPEGELEAVGGQQPGVGQQLGGGAVGGGGAAGRAQGPRG